MIRFIQLTLVIVALTASLHDLELLFEVAETPRDDQVADVIVRVAEGDQFRVGRLEFEGNTRTRDKVLRREFRLPEGAYMAMGIFRSSVLVAPVMRSISLAFDCARWTRSIMAFK